MLRHIKLKTKLDSEVAPPSRIDILSSVMSSSSFNSWSSSEEDSYDETYMHSQSCSSAFSRCPTEWATYVESFSPQIISMGDYNNFKRKVSFDVSPADTTKRMKFSHDTSSPTNTNILYQMEDAKHLNELHCLVRRNIEFFVATDEDVSAPCPGRKESIRKGQVGLRCIHCRHTFGRERMKRAICYPSSVDRVYRCVSDMKFDHFPHCLPTHEKTLFQQLKQCSFSTKKGLNICTYGSGTTSQYYRDSAEKLGLRDSKDGSFVVMKDDQRQAQIVIDTSTTNLRRKKVNLSNFHPYDHGNESFTSGQAELSNLPPLNDFTPRLLSEPDDVHFLNPIHCFVRQNVEVFSADESDIALPAPGRKSQITLGQIGIRCIHCKNLKVKERVKRAICYPPTVSGIYHSVSNMKFDHFAACRGLSASKRQEFVQLKSWCYQKDSEQTKGSKRGNFTARYYAESARKLGLVDTQTGIRTVHRI